MFNNIKKYFFVIIWFLAFFISCYIAWLAVQINLGILPVSYSFIFIALHLLSVIIIFFSPFLYPVKERLSIRFHANLCACISLFLPIIGIIGCTIMFIVIKYIIKPKGLVDVFQESTKYYVEKVMFEEEIKDINLFIHDELNVDPIIDILNGSDDNLKRGAVEFLVQLSTPEAVKLIKKCLTDNNTEIRFYAHSNLTKLDEKFNRRIRELLSNNLNSESNKIKRKNFFKLGNAYREYAKSGLLDKETSFHYSSLANEAYTKYLKKNPNDISTIIILGRLNDELKKYDEAVKFYATAINAGSKSAEPFLGLCKVYYDHKNMGAFIKIIKKMNQMKQLEFANEQEKTVVQFWTKSL